MKLFYFAHRPSTTNYTICEYTCTHHYSKTIIDAKNIAFAHIQIFNRNNGSLREGKDSHRLAILDLVHIHSLTYEDRPRGSAGQTPEWPAFDRIGGLDFFWRVEG